MTGADFFIVVGLFRINEKYRDKKQYDSEENPT